MAAITGIPNFFNTGAPAASDFNNAGKAILTQIGGTYYSESLASYTQSPGNLDSSNISASAGFRNSQKSEPFSFGTFTSVGSTSASGNAVINAIPFAPAPYSIFLTSAAFYSSDATAAGSTAGTVDMYINNGLYQTFNISNALSGDKATWAPFYIDIGVPLGVGDWFYFDFTNLSGFGNGGGLPAPTAKGLACSVSYKAYHIGI